MRDFVYFGLVLFGTVCVLAYAAIGIHKTFDSEAQVQECPASSGTDETN